MRCSVPYIAERDVWLTSCRAPPFTTILIALYVGIFAHIYISVLFRRNEIDETCKKMQHFAKLVPLNHSLVNLPIVWSAPSSPSSTMTRHVAIHHAHSHNRPAIIYETTETGHGGRRNANNSGQCNIVEVKCARITDLINNWIGFAGVLKASLLKLD